MNKTVAMLNSKADECNIDFIFVFLLSFIIFKLILQRELAGTNGVSEDGII